MSSFLLRSISNSEFTYETAKESLDLRPFDPSGLDPKARKAFPLRLSHFLTDITRVRRELAWEPRFDACASLVDSYQREYKDLPTSNPDFSADQALIGKA